MHAARITGMADVLAAAGAEAPDRATAEALARDGYALLADVADAGWLAALRAGVEAAFAAAAAAGGEHGTRHAADVIGGDPAFDGVVLAPRVLGAAWHVLQAPLRVALTAARDPRPGHGQQALHTDWQPQPATAPPRVVTTLWLLDDFTAENGATRVVPGSHRLGPVPKAFAQPAHRHPQERLVTGRAGSVLVFSGHLWHGGTRNDGTGTRRALQFAYVVRGAPGWHMAATPPPARLHPAARWLLLP